VTGGDERELGEDWPPSEPLTDPHPADVDLLLRVLRRVEADAHRKGWDSTPMTLFTVYEHGDEDTDYVYRKLCGANPRTPVTVRVGGYTAQAIIPPQLLTGTPGVPPYEALRTYAMNLAYCPDDSDGYRPVNVIRSVLRLRGVIAVGCVYEAWQRLIASDQALAAELADAAPDYSTMPDSVEMRVAAAVDLEGRLHQVKRTRGDRPVTVGGYTVLVPGHGEVQQAADVNGHGDVSNSLRILADMIVGKTPADQEGFDARYRGYRQMIREELDRGSATGG
jgi:hypothetical protein